MKVILSKKGYDDSDGCYPSIILPEGDMIPFPIPVSYKEEWGPKSEDIKLEVHGKEKSLSEIFSELGHKNCNLKHHLDPDINRNIKNSIAAKSNVGVFGQSWTAGSWLKKEKVEPGDIFIFYGTFNFVKNVQGKFHYEKCWYPFHAIWGYLQVDRVLNIEEETKLPKEFSFIKKHPHWINRSATNSYRKNNTVFIGKNFGVLNFRWEDRLSKLGCKKTFWEIPKVFEEIIINHGFYPPKFFKSYEVNDKSVIVRVASRLQECVIKKGDILTDWIHSIGINLEI